MAELLNNIKHKDVKIITERRKSLGDDVGGSLLLPFEFMEAHKEYPIYFQKSPDTGAFQSVALFGFENNENLFLKEPVWDAEYIPALIRRDPFLIGVQQNEFSGEKNYVVHIDSSSPRVSVTEGLPLFLEAGGNSPFLQEITQMLLAIHRGLDEEKEFFNCLIELDLLEAFTLDVVFDGGAQFKTQHYYTIHQENFYKLDDATLGRLHRAGLLQKIYYVLASLGNIKKLIKKKNAIIVSAS